MQIWVNLHGVLPMGKQMGELIFGEPCVQIGVNLHGVLPMESKWDGNEIDQSWYGVGWRLIGLKIPVIGSKVNVSTSPCFTWDH